MRAAVIGVAALVVLASTRRKRQAGGARGGASSPASGPHPAAPSRAEVLAAQEMAKKLVVDMERVRAETESMITARSQAERARQEAVAAEAAAKEALAAAEQRAKEAERERDGGASGRHFGSGQPMSGGGGGSASSFGYTVQHVAVLLLLLGLLLATSPAGSDGVLQRGTLVAAAWLAYACAMAGACLHA